MTEPKRVMATLEWTGGMRFAANKPGGPPIRLDADGVEGPSPITALVSAVGACSGADVVSVLAKKRMPLTRFRVEVGGRRRDDDPRRFVAIWIRFTLSGKGLTEAAAQRAVDLSVKKYCSVLLSLNPDIPVTTEIVIE
jgi:putative redox protein